MRGKRIKFALLGAAVAAAVAGGGVAYAAWHSTGSGTASAASTKDTASVITAHGTATANLYPGASSPVQIDITNPNPYPVIVTSISSASSALVNATCAAGSVYTDAISSASGIAQTGGPTIIPASGSATYQLTGHMVANPDDACKSQSFPLSLTASLQSAAS